MNHSQRDSQVRNRQRENILTAAESCFIEQGIALTTINGITNKAGIYRRTIYNYFENKEEIACAIFQRYSKLDLSIEKDKELTGYQLLESVFSQLVDHLEQYRSYILFAVQFEYYFHHAGEDRKIIESGVNFNMVNLLTEVLSRGVEDNSIILPDGDFSMIVQSVLQMLLGYLLRVVHREEVFIVESGFSMDHFELSLKILLRGFKNEQ